MFLECVWTTEDRCLGALSKDLKNPYPEEGVIFTAASNIAQDQRFFREPWPIWCDVPLGVCVCVSVFLKGNDVPCEGPRGHGP